MPSSVTVSVLSTERLFPASRPTTTQGSTERRTQLSIIDATVANFSVTGAIWYLDAAREHPATALSAPGLRDSLRRTLDFYPQWSGRLRMAPYDPGQHLHSARYGRLELCHGGASDPGVGFVVTSSPATLAALVPDAAERAGLPYLKGDGMAREDVFLPSTPLASAASAAPDHGDPCMIVQVTGFACGGAAVAVEFSHPLADAQTLSYFVRDWARVHSALASGSAVPSPAPLFRPGLIDAAASGSIDAPSPDPALLERAHALPCLRYDWWASAEGSVFPPASTARPDAFADEPAAKAVAANGQRIPWQDLDFALAVSHSVLHFTPAQLERVWRSATEPGAPAVSRHDALIAHVWACVNRARNLAGDADLVHCNVTFGLRKRLDPPLPDSFLGSPLMMADVALPASSAAAARSLPATAARIRSTLARFTAEAIGAHLHSVAYELSPQRLWQACLGTRHMIVTSWVHTGAYGVDFGTGAAPRYVHPIMPFCDGCVQIMEGAPVAGEHGEGRDGEGKWYADGVDVSVYVTAEATARLLVDPGLHP